MLTGKVWQERQSMGHSKCHGYSCATEKRTLLEPATITMALMLI